jgi:hypothetical protein
VRTIKKKKSELKLVLNSLKPHDTDPTLLECKFIILDFEKSRNNVIVSKETALDTLASSIINKPIRGYFIENENEDNFGGHEAYIKENKNGEQTFERSTIPMGVFTSEGYVETIEINGESKEVLVADAVLWYSQFKAPIDLLVDWFNEGVTISMSCEYLFYNYEIKDGIEYHYSPIYLEAHCVLGKDITPAYDSAKLIDYSQLNQFKQLVAQAMNQEKGKEDVTLDENVKDENLDVTEPVVEPEAQLENQELEQTELEAQTDIEGEIAAEAVVVQEEVQEEPEFDVVVNELKEQLDKMKADKEELAVKLNEATETILSLNQTIKELKPFQELALNTQREEKLKELNEKFSKAFNNAGATDKFESEEVQTLLNEAVDSVDALSQLNSMVVDLVMNLQAKETQDIAILGMNSERKDLIEVDEDEFEKRFKL